MPSRLTQMVDDGGKGGKKKNGGQIIFSGSMTCDV
jgi:hypothetical protein